MAIFSIFDILGTKKKRHNNKMKGIRIDITSKKHDDAYQYLWEAIMMICERYKLSYYEIFGLLQSAILNLNADAEMLEEIKK